MEISTRRSASFGTTWMRSLPALWAAERQQMSRVIMDTTAKNAPALTDFWKTILVASGVKTPEGNGRIVPGLKPRPPKERGSSSSELGPRMRALASDDDVLLGVIERDALAGLNGRDGHAGSDGVTVASFDVGVGPFAVADASEPIADVGDGHVVCAGIGPVGNGGIRLTK